MEHQSHSRTDALKNDEHDQLNCQSVDVPLLWLLPVLVLSVHTSVTWTPLILKESLNRIDGEEAV